MQPRTPIVPPATPIVAASTPVVVPPPKVDSKVEFMKGIKHTTSEYVEFTDAKKWYDQKKKIMVTAASHGVSVVLNPKYKPTDPDLFKEQSHLCFQYLNLSYVP